MSNYSATSQYSNSGAPGIPASSTILSQQEFLGKVDKAKNDTRELSGSIQKIASLHQASLTLRDNVAQDLEKAITDTQVMTTSIRGQIKNLELDAAKTQDGTKNVKARQVKQLKTEFEKALKDYQQEEVTYRQRYREQIARQYRIVNPNATDAQALEASEQDWSSEGVFQAAVSIINWLYLDQIL
jgi:syntaxin 1B/2/3